MNAYRRGVRLSVTISPRASAAIDRLLMRGLNGRSRAEVAMWLIYEGLGKYPEAWGLRPVTGVRSKRGRTR